METKKTAKIKKEKHKILKQDAIELEMSLEELLDKILDDYIKNK